MKKIIILSFVHFLLIKPVYSQVTSASKVNPDSLKHLLAVSKEDTNKVNIYRILGRYYQWTSPDSSLSYLNPGLQLAKKLNYTTGQLMILLAMEEPLSTKGNYLKALQASFQGLTLAKKMNNPAYVSSAYFAIANCYYYSGDYEKSLLYYRKLKSNTAYFNSLREVFTGLIGRTYYYLNLDSALKYTRQAYEEGLKVKSDWPVPYVYLGKIYQKKGMFKQAVYCSKMGVSGSWPGLTAAEGYNNLAGIYKNMGDVDSSIFYANKALGVSTKLSLLSQIIDASSMLSTLYKSKHIADSALKYQDVMLAAKDSVFSKEKIEQMQNISFNEQMREQEILKKQEEHNTFVRMYSLIAIVIVFFGIAIILWRNNRYKQRAYKLLNQQKEQIQKTLGDLKATQTQLIQSEKMASLGELTAGIAHEIQNPLNFVNNFSEVSVELLEELKEEAKSGNKDDVIAIADDLTQNLQKINHHGKRADFIVKGMLEHSRTGTGERRPTDINTLADEFLKLSYHGLRAKDKNFNAEMITHFDPDLPKANIVAQDIGRVLLNLFNNAFYAVNQKKKTADESYKPEVTVTTETGNGQIIISVKDNGSGIPDAIKDKIMQPFFTTKPTGEGTGLGLSLSYDIVVKGHNGSITVDTKEGEFTEFVVSLPV